MRGTGPVTAWRRVPPLVAWVAAAGLVALGHGPAWMVLVWAFGLWAARSSDLSRRTSAAMPVLLALAGALPGLPDLLAFTGTFVHLALAGFALHLALDALEERASVGLAWLALVWVTAPTAPGLLGLALAAGVYGADSQRGARRLTTPRAVGALAAVAALVALASAFLPAAPPLVFSRPPAAGRPEAAPARPAPAEPATGRRAPTADPDAAPPLVVTTGGRTATARQWVDRLLDLALLLQGVFVVLLAWRLWRQRSRSGGSWHWSEIAFAVALVAALVLFPLSILLRTRGADGGGAAASTAGGGAQDGAAGAAARFLDLDALVAGFGWAGVAATALVCLFLIAAIVVLLRLPFQNDEEKAARGAPAPAVPAVPPPPLHRVREAYRRALEALGRAGVARAAHETPSELAARAALVFPALDAALTSLTRLYEPVRYGALPSEEGADRAERAADEIERALAAPPVPQGAP